MNVVYDDRYLDLLAKAVTFSLWQEPLRPLSVVARPGFVGWVARGLDRGLRHLGGLRLCIEVDREKIGGWPMLAHTMNGLVRMANIRKLCEIVVQEDVPGSFVECGVWRGGGCIYARACLPEDRKVVCCDSFDGLPFDEDEPDYCKYDMLKVSLAEVGANFDHYGLNRNVQFVSGFFDRSLGAVEAPIAILRADGDMKSSTEHILNLEPKVSSGGFVIIDDYELLPCREAVDAYRKAHGITAPMQDIDGRAVYWRKDT